jgi:hypothetical protein
MREFICSEKIDYKTVIPGMMAALVITNHAAICRWQQ